MISVNKPHFHIRLPTQMSASVAIMLLFIAHLHAGGNTPSSIVSNVPAIAYFHKVDGFADPSKCFIVVKVLAGARNIGSVPMSLCRFSLVWCLPCPLGLHLGINALCSVL